MNINLNDLHRAEQAIDKKLKEKPKCEHGNKAEECKKCRQSALKDYFAEGLKSLHSKGH